ncbi:MAG: fatty acid desaturase [Proteobacteria bacterium]|nr:fatty acid desaturase [Pseudomonadota bacterium]
MAKAASRPGAVVWRFGLANLLLVAAIAGVAASGWTLVAVMAIALMLGSPADEAAGDEHALAGGGGRWFYVANLYAAVPLLIALTVVHQWVVANSVPVVGAARMMPVTATTFVVGYFYALVGATVAHELAHRSNDALAQVCARVLLALTLNVTFPIYHVHGHHRHVGLYRDAATARRGETALAFIARTVVAQTREAMRFEAERLASMNRSVFSPYNRVLSAQAYPLLMTVAAWMMAGPVGALAFLSAALIGRFLHELMNYVQHYGLVRVEGSPIAPRHTWDCYRRLSNGLQFNLPRHSDHHMFAARPFWDLRVSEAAPVLPFGYQTMALIALVGPLWRRRMHPLLADWDRRLASDAERALVHERGWDAIV